MAEAAIVLDVPATLKQQRLAAVLTDKVNPPKTKREALTRAGYSPVTASASSGRALSSVGLQRAATALQERQKPKRDKAREILEAGLDQMGKRIETARDESVAAFVKVSSDVLASGVTETGSSVTDADHIASWEMIRRGLAMAYRMGMRAGLARRKPVLKAHTGRFRLWHNVSGYVELPDVEGFNVDPASLQNSGYRTLDGESLEEPLPPHDPGTVAP